MVLGNCFFLKKNIHHCKILLAKLTSRGGGGAAKGGTLIFSYKRRLGLFYGVQTFEFQHFFGFPKNVYSLGMKIFVDIFWVIAKLDYFGRNFYAF